MLYLLYLSQSGTHPSSGGNCPPKFAVEYPIKLFGKILVILNAPNSE